MSITSGSDPVPTGSHSIDESRQLRAGDIGANLLRGEDGIWYTREREAVSYPADAHEAFADLESSSFWFRHRNRCIIELLRRFPPSGLVADIGGGNGVVSLAMQNEGVDTVLLEPGMDGIRNAQRRGVANLICATLESANIHPHTLPAAGLFDVLEHVQDDVNFLRSISGALIPGGRLYLTVPAHPALWSAEDVAAGHFRRYTRATLESTLRAGGFDVDYVTPFFAPLVPAIFLFRALPSRAGLRRDTSFTHAGREHLATSGGMRTIMERLLSRELRAIRSGRTLRTGASLLATARPTPR